MLLLSGFSVVTWLRKRESQIGESAVS